MKLPSPTPRLAALLLVLAGCASDEGAAGSLDGAAASGTGGMGAAGGGAQSLKPSITGKAPPADTAGVATGGQGGADVSAGGSGGIDGSGGASVGGTATGGQGGTEVSTGGSGGAGGMDATGGAGAMGAAGGADSGGSGGMGGSVPTLPPREGPMKLTSPTFEAEGMLEPKTLCQGGNVSPPLMWTRGPEGTLSYAVTMVHEGNRALHWALWDIPATTLEVHEDVAMVPEPPAPAGTKQHKADLDSFTFHGHIGGCPGGPKAGPGRQGRYEYEAMALDVETLPEITPESSSDDVASALSAHRLEGAIIVGVGRSPE